MEQDTSIVTNFINLLEEDEDLDFIKKEKNYALKFCEENDNDMIQEPSLD